MMDTATMNANLIVAALLCGVSAPAVAASPHYQAEIRRTAYGIPHIRAQDEASLGFGIGYAYAQDNLCLLADEIVTVNSRRSEFFGPDLIAGPDIDSGYTHSTNRNLDLYFKLVNSDARVASAWERQLPEVKALFTGYAAGFNRYLADTPRDRVPAACRNVGWLRPITALDLIRLVRRYEVEFSSLRFIDALATAAPGAAAKLAAAQPERPRSHGIGSNAVALGKDATENGRGLLLGNPHYPWHGILRFYQMHLTIPGKMDVMGVSLPGIPAVAIGFTKDFAWSHTVNTSVHFTLYKLDLDPKDPTRYRVGDSWRPLTRESVTIKVKGADGQQAPVSHDFWNSIYGPILSRADGLAWDKTTAYAIRDANLDNNQMVETWYAMARAGSLDGAETAIRGKLGLPWINTVAADKAGRALYLSVTPVPNLSAEKRARCILPTTPALEQEAVFVLSGSDPDCAWDEDSAAARPGIVPGTALPGLWRSDYVQNSNDSAWMTNPAQPLTGYSPLISKQDELQGGRTRMGVSQIEAGLADGKFTMKALQNATFDNHVFAARLARQDLMPICADAGTVTVGDRAVPLAKACETLRAWDGNANTDSIGYPLFAAWWDRLEGNPAIWAMPFSAADPIDTPRRVKGDDPVVRDFARKALAEAILYLEEKQIDWTRPWGAIQYVDVAGRHVPVPGGAGGDVYNIVYSLSSGPPDGRMLIRSGSSYIQFVGFEESGPVVDAILTYSQSADPASPHHADQIAVFSTGQWIRQPFTDAQIKADPAYQTVTVTQ